jgi:hypothetical protein
VKKVERRKTQPEKERDTRAQGGFVSRARPQCDKMASSLTADSFFNLSTQHQFNYNKELIYVKLTDSALRAIEEYARNQVGIRLKSPFLVLGRSFERLPSFLLSCLSPFPLKTSLVFKEISLSIFQSCPPIV